MRINQGGYQPRQETGFTLMEIIATLAVASVLTAAAVSATSRMLARYELSTAQLDLIASLQHARGLAVSSRRPTLFCPSPDGRRCGGVPSWEGGWAIGNYRSGQADQLEGLPALVSGGYPRAALRITSDRKSIRFQPTGSAGGSPVTFTLCRKGYPADALGLIVSNVGRVASARPSADAAARCAANH